MWSSYARNCKDLYIRIPCAKRAFDILSVRVNLSWSKMLCFYQRSSTTSRSLSEIPLKENHFKRIVELGKQAGSLLIL
jgi:hypothetical protein